VAEIGIVIASLAVLLSNRAAWLVSIILALLCVGMLANTFWETRKAVAQTNQTIQQAQGAYRELRKLHLSANKDERTVEQLDPGAKIRPEIQTEGQKATDESDH
jgi:cell division protein FtsL